MSSVWTLEWEGDSTVTMCKNDLYCWGLVESVGPWKLTQWRKFSGSMHVHRVSTVDS